jgi:hypothetical protein
MSTTLECLSSQTKPEGMVLGCRTAPLLLGDASCDGLRVALSGYQIVQDSKAICAEGLAGSVAFDVRVRNEQP